jgi:hypothetical protein
MPRNIFSVSIVVLPTYYDTELVGTVTSDFAKLRFQIGPKERGEVRKNLIGSQETLSRFLRSSSLVHKSLFTSQEP